MALSKPNEVTLALVGRTGNGKSATGNSILQRNAFKSKVASGSITKKAELQQGVLGDGRGVNVLDTPGLFDFAVGSDNVSKKIANCINLAKDGIHAILLVLSVRSRFTEEEAEAIQVLRGLFGPKITDYLIIVFTGADVLEDDEATLQDYLDANCPQPLQEVLQLCKHRTALFNNKTKNAKKRASQINELIILVDKIFTENGGKPYTNELFLSLQEETKRQRKMKEEAELQALAKKETARLQEQMQKAYDAQLARVTETIESKLSGTISSLERELAETRQAHQNAVSHSHMAHQQAMNEIHALQHNLSAAHQEIERLRRPPPRPHRLCAIM
ncbi:PREDICTED: immune-associated nucleotide-binding protein 8-like isoform X1 [Nelumbo nucifera]|uniref:Immune-associated nucleotide-binding protein 8-like isoform X1 n=1 Tax=Nelumbo nucifera TaxID=4432 RepID=A0A1U8A0S6_NELNU|nr:PREDICTED: immune-associated nucleotide-binding protein 8-like isoform X1 [Nelumbo nucifera]